MSRAMPDGAAFLAWFSSFLEKSGKDVPQEFPRDQGFAHYGLDSVDVVILAADFEDHFGVPADPAFFLRFDTLGQLLDELS